MNIPGVKTLEVLERRRNYLIKKESRDMVKIRYQEAEIKALEEIIRFTEMVITKIPFDMINKSMDEYESENEITNECVTGDDLLKNHKIFYMGKTQCIKKYNVLYTFIEEDGRKYIILKGKKYNKRRHEWKTQGTFIFSMATLDEVIEQYKKTINDEIKIMGKTGGKNE